MFELAKSVEGRLNVILWAWHSCSKHELTAAKAAQSRGYEHLFMSWQRCMEDQLG